MLLLLASGCTVSSSRGALLRTSPPRERCANTRVTGRLVAEAEVLKLTLQASPTCERYEELEYQLERHATPPRYLSVGLGVLAGAVVGVPTVLGISYGLGRLGLNGQLSKGGDALFALALVPALAVGTGTAFAVSSVKSRLADGEIEHVERLVSSEQRPELAPSGTLRADDDPHTWPVENGQTTLPIGDLRNVRLDRLLFDGVLVSLDGESARLAESLNQCRKALKGWTPEEACPAVASRAPAVRQCAEFWPSVRELEARLRSCEPPPRE